MRWAILAVLLAGCEAFRPDHPLSNWPFKGPVTAGDRAVEEFARQVGVDPFSVTCHRDGPEWMCSTWRSPGEHGKVYWGTVK